MKFLQFKKLTCRSDIQRALKSLSGMLSVKAGRGWVQWLLKVAITLRGGNTRAIARSAVYFIRVLRKVYLHEGYPGVVIKTKAWYVLAMQSTGGMRIPSAQHLGCAVARTRSGMPRVIPSQIRQRIKQGDRFLLRLWLSWFSIYRVLEIPSKIKLQTITNPGKVLSPSLVREAKEVISEFCKTLGYKGEGSANDSLPPVRLLQLSKSTPSLVGPGKKVSSSYQGIINGAYALKSSPIQWAWSKLAERIDPLSKIQQNHGGLNLTIQTLWQRIAQTSPIECPKFPLGKLGFKKEAAGKVRVFAMVECWTQWLLYPLHLFIFELLGKMPTDGTMDQLAPLTRLQNRKNTKFWCYDLSAATDRLPVSIQALILDHLFGDNFGQYWKELLVGRKYLVPDTAPKGCCHTGIFNRKYVYERPDGVYYSVGQPMGALSSWAMLALTHHMIVAWAAHRVGFKIGSFTEYAVLGDDIIICDGRVANAYLQLMETLGVEIGLAKSLISRKGVLEFAKRFYVQGVDCSPVPFKEMVAALNDFESSSEFITKYKLGARSIAAFIGYGYRVRGRLSATWDRIPRKLATVGIWRASPWGSLAYRWSDWVNIKSFVIRREWITSDPLSDPTLPDLPRQHVQALMSKDLKAMDKLRAFVAWERGDSLPAFWLNLLLRESVAMNSKASDEFLEIYQRGLHTMRIKFIKDNLPSLKADYDKVISVLSNWNKYPLSDQAVKDWVESRRMKDLLVKPSILGNEPKTRSNQSILAATRLWHLASKEVKIEQVKPADPNRFRITPPKVESKPQRIWIPALGTWFEIT